MLLPDRLTLMQRVQDAARHGYEFYVTGQAKPERWPALQAKFAGLYDTELARSTRSKRRRAGEAVALLYGAEPAPFEEGQVPWVLVATAGRGRVHGREQLERFDGKRIELGGYELVHDGVRWSWRMTRQRFNYWRERIHAVAARPPERRQSGWDAAGALDPEIEAVMDALYNAPGFRLTRRQVGELVAYARGEWTRLRPAGGPAIRTRTFLPYVQRLANRRKRAPASVPE